MKKVVREQILRGNICKYRVKNGISIDLYSYENENESGLYWTIYSVLIHYFYLLTTTSLQWR